MDVKSLYIVNSFDRPCVRLIARLTTSGKLKYIAESLNHFPEFEIQPTSCTLADFGFEHTGLNKFELKHNSKAKYENGRIREWQDVKEFTLDDIIDA